MITVNNIFVKKFKQIILNNISFHIPKNKIISIIGKNGSGKSTLCKVLIGAVKISSGNLYKMQNINISYVPQIFERSILIPLKVKDFLLLNLHKDCNNRFTSYLNLLIEKLQVNNILNHNLNTISGGEMQKVLLIRALIRRPNLLILDESFSFLDLSSLLQIHNIIFEEQKKYGFSILFISHDIEFVIKNTNHVICLDKGSIHCQGNYYNIKEYPYINDFIGKYTHNSEQLND